MRRLCAGQADLFVSGALANVVDSRTHWSRATKAFQASATRNDDTLDELPANPSQPTANTEARNSDIDLPEVVSEWTRTNIKTKTKTPLESPERAEGPQVEPIATEDACPTPFREVRVSGSGAMERTIRVEEAVMARVYKREMKYGMQGVRPGAKNIFFR